MRYIISFLITVLFATNAMADQLIVKEGKFRQGYAYTLNVDNTEMCIKTITNISNADDSLNFDSLGGQGKRFLCITKDGDVDAYGSIYQIPFTKDGEMCLRWSGWDGLHLTDQCEEEGATYRAVIFDGSIRDYLRDYVLDKN